MQDMPPERRIRGIEKHNGKVIQTIQASSPSWHANPKVCITEQRAAKTTAKAISKAKWSSSTECRSGILNLKCPFTDAIRQFEIWEESWERDEGHPNVVVLTARQPPCTNDRQTSW
jgi:hypothetical protein